LPWLLVVLCLCKWSLGQIFQSLWWMSFRFRWELHWTCTLLLVVQPFLLCWFCKSISMGDLSTFCSLQSLSSVVCSSPCRGHLHPLLSLFLGIWFFLRLL
jgi:hypothetical protein